MDVAVLKIHYILNERRCFLILSLRNILPTILFSILVAISIKAIVVDAFISGRVQRVIENLRDYR